MSDGWGGCGPLYRGDALVDIHAGRGTIWKRNADGQLYPDCDCHRPAAITEERKRAGVISIAEHRGRSRKRHVAADATPTPETAPEAGVPPRGAPDQRAVRGLIAMLREMLPKGEDE